MRKFKISLYIYIGVLSIIFPFFSCGNDSGLGEEIDLEAPVLKVTELTSDGETITDFLGGASCKKEVSFTGTATDNNRIERVYAEVKWSDEDSFKTIASTSVSGDKWSLNLSFGQEGTCFVRIVAEDPAKNYSPNSSKTIPLRVDNSAPVASSWYIDREIGGVQYNLRELSALKEINLDLAENKDAAQNVAFTICANASDLFGISKDGISIQIRDESGNKICDVENSAETGYAPKFRVTHDALVAGKSELSTGKHYLQVWYDAEDDVEGLATPNVANDVEVEVGWFIWWPESDLPHVTNSEIVTDSLTSALSMNVHINDVISLSFFDDDLLKEGYFALLTESESADFGEPDWSAIEENPETLFSKIDDEAKKNRTAAFKADNKERETVVALKASDSPQNMRLLAIAWDATDGNDGAGVVCKKDISVRVTDDATPILLITSPKNNSVPALAMSSDNSSATVTIEGQTLDSAGCSYLEFVWVPDSIATTGKQAKAKEWLETLIGDAHKALIPASGEGAKVTENNGMKLWSAELTDNGSQSGFISSKFSFTVDIFNDFVCNGTDERKNTKYFLAKLTRKDGNSIYQEYTLTADSSLPEIVPITPAGDGQIQDVSDDLNLEFYGQKESGLAIASYKIELVGLETSLGSDGKPKQISENSVIRGELKDGTVDTSIQTYQATVSKEFLAACKLDGIMPKFKFYATDLFGYTGTAQYSLNLTDLPQITGISSTSSTLAKLGDEILIDVSFSNTITVTSGYENKVYLKLKNIQGTASNRDKAYYKSGSGSTTLTFAYKVQEGDSTSSDSPLEIDFTSGTSPIETGGATSLSEGTNVHLKTLTESNILIGSGKKEIAIDGVSPKGTLSLSSDAAAENNHDGTTYLRAGRTLTLTLTSDDDVTVQGSPSAVFTAGSSTITLPLKSTTSRTITFSRTVLQSDTNGTLTFKEIENADVIKDSAGNKIIVSASISEKFAIDTDSPAKPSIMNETGTALTSGKYQNQVKFTLKTTDSDIAKTEYSLNDGTTWNEYSSATNSGVVTVTSSAKLTAKSTDWAGNESSNADTVNLDISSTFPAFQIDCTDSDGTYPAGNKLTFTVTFAEKVTAPSNTSDVYIQLSALTGTVGGDGSTNNGRATFTSFNASTNVATFTYTVQDPDEFTLKVAQNGVVLTGFKDEYGFEWTNAKTLSADYGRADLKCDGVAPKVVEMTPGGSKGNNVYANGNVITLVFDEEIQKASGNITLRQVKLWPIPPVLSGDDFNTICNKLNDNAKKDILAMCDSDGNELEDMEDLEAGIHYANDMYHGTGQFIGPYKKSSQGLLESGSGDNAQFVPDTSTKYVLDFRMGIWETNDSYYFGKTFPTGQTYNHDASSESNLKVLAEANYRATDSVNKKNTRTVQEIRDVLEEAHYHERILDVTSSAVKLTTTNGKTTVEITFPKGLCDTSADLPYGREWELVIDKGAFMDTAGNKFGAEANGSEGIAAYYSDAVQVTGGTKGVQYTLASNKGSGAYTTYTGSWGTAGRGKARSSNSGTPVVLIKNGSNESFYSDKVATPVVRVERYSYGLGIYQPTASENEGAVSAYNYIAKDSTKPSGFVRVRIDCETADVTTKFKTELKTSTPRYPSNPGTQSETDSSGDPCKIYITNTDFPASLKTSVTPSVDYTANSIFAVGNGSYTNSFKGFVIAKATKTNFTESDPGYEGVFQTVARIYQPTQGNGWRADATIDKGEDYRDFSIRGTTYWGGEPSITPFPLRDSRNGSPYLRRTFNEYKTNSNSTDYYWVSTEVLADSSFSGYSYGSTRETYWGYNWCKNWGYMYVGEAALCTGMKNWESY